MESNKANQLKRCNKMKLFEIDSVQDAQIALEAVKTLGTVSINCSDIFLATRADAQKDQESWCDEDELKGFDFNGSEFWIYSVYFEPKAVKSAEEIEEFLN